MKSTMDKYAQGIENDEINPIVTYDGRSSGLLLDPRREDTPLDLIGFGLLQLTSETITLRTEEKEMVLVPQEGQFEAEVGGQVYKGDRLGGPFALGPGKSNASALYVPSQAELKIRGQGEIAFFQAPALRQKTPFYRSSAEVSVVSRGEWVWRRDVVSLVSPATGSSNLIVGETYNPPGLWSGTPLHRHDRDDPQAGESDHEEIYYHRFSWKKKKEEEIGPYGVQLLMDGNRLKKAYLITDRSIAAIPGGCHPVVAAPVSELIYLWGLAGLKMELAMKDLPEFVHLKRFEEFFKTLEGAPIGKTMDLKKLRELAGPFQFSEEEFNLLKAILKEKGPAII